MRVALLTCGVRVGREAHGMSELVLLLWVLCALVGGGIAVLVLCWPEIGGR